MDSLLAAAIVTLIVNTSEDKVSGADGKLSLREAIAEANSDPRPHRIVFKGKGVPFQYLVSALEVHARGALIIDGDADDDGLADVALLNGYAEKLIVRKGSDVTIIGVDFYNGSGSGEAGVNGAQGADGGQGLAGLPGKVTPSVTPPTKGGPGGEGKPGKNGTRGENVAGIIHNFGKLHLIRLGLSSGYAVAGFGGNGGAGGWGGYGGSGGDGIGSNDEYWLDREYIIQDGAAGGNSGDGADGGDGGDGGSAGGAILNEATGKLTLTDVTFGGRLGGWLIDEGSTAIAGFGGFFGVGGDGRPGGTGGDGGNQGYTRSFVNPFVWVPPGGGEVNSGWSRFTQSDVGQGGKGGNGGSRGADGRFGKPGDAASAVLNLGAINGQAAIGDDGEATGGAGRTANPPAYTNGEGGLGGFKGGRRQDTFSYCYDIALKDNPDFTQTALANAPGDYVLSEPENEGRLPSAGRSPGRSSAGSDAPRAKSVAAGKAKLGILNSGGKGSVKSAASLVFVHPLGVQTAKAGKTLDFNVVRLGKGGERVTVKWEILPATKGPSVSPADFGRPALPKGSVTFAPIPAGAAFDVDNSVKLVSIPIRRDTLDEPPEGYRMVLTDASAASVLLGTKLVEGKLQD